MKANRLTGPATLSSHASTPARDDAPGEPAGFRSAFVNGAQNLVALLEDPIWESPVELNRAASHYKSHVDECKAHGTQVAVDVDTEWGRLKAKAESDLSSQAFRHRLANSHLAPLDAACTQLGFDTCRTMIASKLRLLENMHHPGAGPNRAPDPRSLNTRDFMRQHQKTGGAAGTADKPGT